MQAEVEVKEIGEEGAAALTEALKENQTLRHLGVNSSELGQFGKATLAEILQNRMMVRAHCMSLGAAQSQTKNKAAQRRSGSCSVQ